MKVPIHYEPLDASTMDWPLSIDFESSEPLTGKTWKKLYDEALTAKVPNYLVTITVCHTKRGELAYGTYDGAALFERNISVGSKDPEYETVIECIHTVSIKLFSIDHQSKVHPHPFDPKTPLMQFDFDNPFKGNSKTSIELLGTAALQGNCYPHLRNPKKERAARLAQLLVALDLLSNQQTEEALRWLWCASYNSEKVNKASQIFKHFTKKTPDEAASKI